MFRAVDQLELKVPVSRDDAAAAAYSVLDLIDRLRREEASRPSGDAPNP
jgi:hypothetical protein